MSSNGYLDVLECATQYVFMPNSHYPLVRPQEQTVPDETLPSGLAAGGSKIYCNWNFPFRGLSRTFWRWLFKTKESIRVPLKFLLSFTDLRCQQHLPGWTNPGSVSASSELLSWGDLLNSSSGNAIHIMAIIFAVVSSLHSVGVSTYQEQLFKVK